MRQNRTGDETGQHSDRAQDRRTPGGKARGRGVIRRPKRRVMWTEKPLIPNEEYPAQHLIDSQHDLKRRIQKDGMSTWEWIGPTGGDENWDMAKWYGFAVLRSAKMDWMHPGVSVRLPTGACGLLPITRRLWIEIVRADNAEKLEDNP
jgi:hypothetical protein